MRKKINIDEFISEFKQTKLFKDLGNEEITWLISRGIFVSHRDGEQIMTEGEESKYLFFVVEGGIVTTRTNGDGEEVYIRLLGKGECALDSVIFIEEKSPIGVRTIEKSVILKIRVQAIKELVETNINFSNNLIKILANFYKDSVIQIDNLSIKDSKSRVGYYLLNTYAKGDQISEEFTLRFKKNIIANYLGMKPETFSRMLKEMQNKEKLISIDGASIKLSTPKSLCEFCDSTIKHICSHKKNGEC